MPRTKLPPRFTEDALERIRTARDSLSTWRRTARDDFAFISGKQWLETDEQILRDQRRPPITFNYSEKMIDAVVGAEVANRQATTYLPRGIEDAPVAETWTNAAKWVREQCNAEDEESDAFRDALICGMGWTSTRLSYDENIDGAIIIERCDPLEMIYDAAAYKRGLQDRRFDARQWWVNKADVRLEWPDAPDFTTPDADTGIDTIQRGNRYAEDDLDKDSDTEIHRDQTLLTHYETFYREPYYRVAAQGELLELSISDFNELKPFFDQMGIQYVKQHRKVYYHAFFSGDTLLEADKSPCQRGFFYQPITAKRDRNANVWYGLTRVMKDPQRWANKWLSQILHIINTNAKGGLLAETGAFVDARRAADEWAQPDAITLLNEGGLNRIQQKQQAPYPTGLDRLMEFALSSLPMVTGINLEALGLANREQAGVLEAQRKQAAYGLLAGFFDSLRLYRKTHGAILLFYINTYIADGRLVRISTDSQQFIPLTKQPGAMDYDVIVDQSPNAPDIKQRTFEALQATLPAILKAGLPLPPDLLDYIPIPTQLAQKWKQFIAQIQQRQQQQGPSPEQLQQFQQQFQQLQQENQQLKLKLQDRSAETQQKAATSSAELQLKAQELQAELLMKRVELEANIALKQAEIASQSQLASDKANAEIRLKSASTLLDRSIAARDTEANSETALKTTEQANSLKGLLEEQQRLDQTLAQLMETIEQRPTAFTIVRDANGFPTGIKPAGS